MITPLVIYLRAVGFYLLATLPLFVLPWMYLISALYVLFYGWFAWALFSVLYLLGRRFKSYEARMRLLLAGVPASVAFAFQMLEVLRVESDVWHSGGYLLFPVAAVIAGWISLLVSRKQVGAECPAINAAELEEKI